MDRELQTKAHMRPRPLLRSASSGRGFGLGGGIPIANAAGARPTAVVERAAEIEQTLASMRGLPAIFETKRGIRVELVFASAHRSTGSAIAFLAREESMLPTLEGGTISFVARGTRMQFAADVTRGKDGRLHASFPTRLAQC